ncbi:hypothetical protein [Actinoplanes palleronii]|uniref:Uncharacterized protein n=1 Tax=Actinoplanes palleronii TaxID=113570 RepID=A0ABQ4BEZ9_9ACTN|nr:hypothetical protein [Actinoplanes palleronii]GIE69263.1 hypothetical protein Apa02nite_053710 [Actinoplanes palleronii]
MPKLTAVLRRSRTAVLLVVAGIFGAVLAMAAPAAAAVPSSADTLVLTWTDGGDLRVTGFGYRARDLVEVRLGSSPIQQTRGDENGRIEVSVPRPLVATGASGASIVLTGRSVSGAARVMISAVPPQAAGRGPVDLLPWVFGTVALAGLAVVVWRRSTGRNGEAPRGYRGCHVA